MHEWVRSVEVEIETIDNLASFRSPCVNETCICPAQYIGRFCGLSKCCCCSRQ